MSKINPLRIVFFGTPDFATHILKALYEQGHHQIVGVVTMPDKPAGRGHKLQPSSVKQFAVDQRLPLLQPIKLRDEEFLKKLKDWQADLFIVVAFRMLPKEVWAMPARGTFNLHASLLPAYRGAAPIQHAILNGERTTGVTTFMLDEKIDTGDVLIQEEVLIDPRETGGSLHDKLMNLGAKVTCQTADLIAQEPSLRATTQASLTEGTVAPPLAPKIFKEDRLLSCLTKSAIEIDRRVRAMAPYPVAIAQWQRGDEEIEVKIFETAVITDLPAKKPGTLEVIDQRRLVVHTIEGAVEIVELQLPSKRRVKAADFLLGYSLDGDQMK